MEAEREEKEAQLKQLQEHAKQVLIELCFGDESGFSMNPKIPSGWAPKGERVEISPQRDKKLNLFGIFRADNCCVTYESGKNIDSEFLIKAIDEFCRYVDKPTVLVLDNAPTHTAEKFLEKIARWMEKNLYIFYLPRYSPRAIGRKPNMNGCDQGIIFRLEDLRENQRDL